MRKNARVFIFSVLICLLAIPVFAQTGMKAFTPDTSRKIIQLSGLVADADSLYPLPFVAIVIRNTSRGVYTNTNGYYSMVAQEKDTIDFYQLGYRKASFVLPDTFTTATQLNHVQSLQIDTIFLREAVIYPWPTKEEFKTAFLTLNVPADDLERARMNLARAETVQSAQSVARDAGMVYSATMRQQARTSASYGQMPTTGLLNPVAWAQFLQALNNGDLKRQ
jgi:hypothetical protein